MHGSTRRLYRPERFTEAAVSIRMCTFSAILRPIPRMEVKLVMSGSVNDFIVNYLDTARMNLAAIYPDFESFEKGFSVDDAMLKSLAHRFDKRHRV